MAFSPAVPAGTPGLELSDAAVAALPRLPEARMDATSALRTLTHQRYFNVRVEERDVETIVHVHPIRNKQRVPQMLILFCILLVPVLLLLCLPLPCLVLCVYWGAVRPVQPVRLRFFMAADGTPMLERSFGQAQYPALTPKWYRVAEAGTDEFRLRREAPQVQLSQTTEYRQTGNGDHRRMVAVPVQSVAVIAQSGTALPILHGAAYLGAAAPPIAEAGNAFFHKHLGAGAATAAAAAAAAASPLVVTVAPVAQPSLADELQKLGALRAAGALTDAEFETAKARLLHGGGGS